VYTGCVATAMAQVLKYWNYPSQGSGSHSYTHATYGLLSADFGSTTYNWTNMPNNVVSSNNSVATLMYHCGVSVEMDYSADGSGAYSGDVVPALVNYFNYSPNVEMKSLNSFSTANWIMMLKAELDAHRPVYYGGDNGTEGHAFVCDGYDTDSKFHFNWGWSGSANGYFAIGALNPSLSYKFNSNNEAIIRIKPPSNAPVAGFTASGTMPDLKGSISFTDQSTNTPTSWSWYFEGGTPSTSIEQNPTVRYDNVGSYLVSLTVSNADGSDTKTISGFINAGGASAAWIKQNTGFVNPSRRIDQIMIVDPMVVWALAGDGSGSNNTIREFTKTTDGGINWTPGTITFEGSSDYGVANIFPLNDQVCYACMFPQTDPTGGYIVKTTDGGTTWAIQPTATFAADQGWADFVHFFNENDGVAMGDPNDNGFVIYTTSDGGENWTLVPYAQIPTKLSSEAGLVNAYDAVGNTLWFGTSKGRIFKSIDKGNTWTASTTGFTGMTIPIFKDENIGIASQSDSPYAIKKTTDGGTSWTTLTPSGTFLSQSHLTFVKGTRALWINVGAATDNIGSSFSSDDCASFINIDKGSVQYTSVAFLDSLTGWAGGFNSTSTDGGIYRWNNNWMVTTDVNPIPSVNQNIKLYPNPTSDLVNIEFSSPLKDRAVITVYNLLGEKVRVFDAASGESSANMSVSGLGSGMYILSVESAGQLITTKRLSIVK